MNLDDACRYLGYWGTGNGDMRATKEVVRQKIIAARDLIKCHPLTPELTTELCIMPMAVLTQELLLHAERCMRHEDVSKKMMLADLHLRRVVMRLFCGTNRGGSGMTQPETFGRD